MQILNDLLHLFYPRLCVSCAREYPPRGSIFCFDCLLDLPKTGYHRERANPFEKHFYGRIPLLFGAAYFHFQREGKVQQMMHGLKYANRPWIGQKIGEAYARELISDQAWPSPDLIIPVPLHPRKRAKRGYNQSMEFAKGLSRASEVRVLPNYLIRKQHTISQTGLDRMRRVENMEGVFQLRRADKLTGKHILLVDDVITTGATLEACALALINGGIERISMLTIAIGN